MVRALEKLMDGAIDYSGLFPPARLDMEAAMANYLTFRSSAPRPILGRFECPAERLQELATELSNEPDIAKVGVAVIGRSCHDRQTWETARECDAKAMNEFAGAAEGLAEIEAYEVAVPDHRHLERYIRELQGFSDVDLLVELPWDGPIQESLSILVEAEIAGAKAHVEPIAGSSTELLATFLHSCVDLDWQFKLSAGLVRLFPTTESRCHGLVNVMAGTALLLSEDLSQRELQSVLEAAASSWRFGPETIACMEYETSLEDILAARDLLVSIGLTSVEEPLQELETLGRIGGRGE